jgi:hypothetical protein
MFQPQPHGDVAVDPLRTDDITAAALSTALMKKRMALCLRKSEWITLRCFFTPIKERCVEILPPGPCEARTCCGRDAPVRRTG